MSYPVIIASNRDRTRSTGPLISFQPYSLRVVYYHIVCFACSWLYVFATLTTIVRRWE